MLISWVLWLLLVTAHDFIHRRVPNWLVAFGIFFGLLSIALGIQPFGLGWVAAFSGASFGFLFLLAFYLLRLMGAGDVKFAGALGLWIGLVPFLLVWTGASLLAGLHAVLWLLLRRWPVSPWLLMALSGARTGERVPLQRTREIPYAAYLAISSLVWIALAGGVFVKN